MIPHEEILSIMEELARQYSKALKNKPIQRIGRKDNKPYSFTAVPYSSGKLANSVQVDAYYLKYNISALHYVHYIEYGRRPGTYPPVNAISQWMKKKGFAGSTYPIARSMYEYGSTIYQRYKGENSGIFDEIDIDKAMKKIEEAISNSVLKDLIKAA